MLLHASFSLLLVHKFTQGNSMRAYHPGCVMFSSAELMTMATGKRYGKCTKMSYKGGTDEVSEVSLPFSFIHRRLGKRPVGMTRVRELTALYSGRKVRNWTALRCERHTGQKEVLEVCARYRNSNPF